MIMDDAAQPTISTSGQPHGLFRRLLYNYLNSGIAGGASVEVRYVNAVSLIGTFDILFSVLLELATGKSHMSAFMLCIALATNLNVVHLRRSHDAGRAATHVLLIMFIMLNVMLIDGMYQNTAPLWLATFPAAAFFFKGKHHGLYWFGAMITSVLIITLLQVAGMLATPYSSSALGLIVASLITVGAIVYVYETLRAKAEADLQKTRKELHQMAHTDMLTGLPNRSDFYLRLPAMLKAAAAQGHRLAILFIDLDNFKPINDTFGHETGDKLLQHAAERLEQQLRHSDFIARFGGDEFVAILPHIATTDDVEKLAGQIVQSLATPFLINGHHCQIGVSIGVGIYPDCASDVNNLVQLADHAMYAAKLDGKNAFSTCPLQSAGNNSSYRGKLSCNLNCKAAQSCGSFA